MSINDHIDKTSDAYDSFDEAVRRFLRAGRGGYCAKADFANAHRQIHVRARDLRLGGVHIPSLGYAFRTRLCFGGRSSEHVWERVVTAVRELVRALHSGALAACLHWVDDLFDILSSREAALRPLQAIVDVARPFQFALSPAKVLLARPGAGLHGGPTRVRLPAPAALHPPGQARQDLDTQILYQRVTSK